MKVFCQSCGHVLPDTNKFCINCGVSVRSEKADCLPHSAQVEPITIYLKSEPAGEICFGRLDDEHISELKELLQSDEMEESSFVYSAFNYANIAHVYGFGGYFDGREIKHPRLPKNIRPQYRRSAKVELPRDAKGIMADGVYLVFYCLSKISREFEFTPADGQPFDATKMTFLYTDISFDNKLLNDHHYGPVDWRFITGYLYKGEEIEEAVDADDTDRGLTTQLLIFQVKNGKTYRIYKNVNDQVVLKTRLRD